MKEMQRKVEIEQMKNRMGEIKMQREFEERMRF